jgi:hypothetical protein
VFEIIPVLFIIGLILISGLMVLFGFSSLEFFFRIKRKGLRTMGSVTYIDITAWGVRPLISFKDQEGKEIEAMAKNIRRGKNTLYKEGDEVVIYYMANEPETFIVDVHTSEIIFVILIMIIGACIFLTTIFSLIFD